MSSFVHPSQIFVWGSIKWLQKIGAYHMLMLSFVIILQMTIRQNCQPLVLCSPNEDLGRMNKKMKCGFSIEFSTIRSLNRVLTSLKSASFEVRILSFVHHSQTFVWEGEFQVEISDSCIACHLAKLLQMEHGMVSTRNSTHRMSACYHHL
jgi:hypothetical protein